MTLITLTSDYGIIDHDVAAFKGHLLSEINDAQVVDISHDVAPYNLMQASYLVNRSFPRFPKGTIHIVLVDSEQGKEKPHLVAELDGQFFIGADNGVLSLIAHGREFDKLIAVDMRNNEDAKHPEDVFIRIASHISKGGKLDVLGRVPREHTVKSPSNPTLRQDGNGIVANVIHIDTFGNLITNVSKTWLLEQAGNRKIEIIARNKRIVRLVDSYFEGPTEGELFGVYNRDGMLEIAVQKPSGRNQNSAWSLLGLQVNSNIFIEFE